jgi:hypothetical protein
MEHTWYTKYKAYTDPWKYQRWDRVPRRESIPRRPVTPTVSPVQLLWMQSHPLSKSVCQVRSNYWYEKCQTTYGSSKVCNYELDHCNGHRTCKTPTSNETLEIPVSSTFLSVVYPNWNTGRMQSRPLHIKSVERYVRDMQVIVGWCYRYIGSWQQQNWNHSVCHTVELFVFRQHQCVTGHSSMKQK